MSCDFLFKIIVVGDSNVGKSSLISRAVNNNFDGNCSSTIGIEFVSTMLKINRDKIKLHIWDTAGQETYSSIVSSYYRNIAGAIIVFDITDKKSFDKLDKWREEIKIYNNNINDIPILIVANKIDKAFRRVIPEEAGQEYARIHSLKYIETSAKRGLGTDDFLKIIVNDIYELMDYDNLPPSSGIKKTSESIIKYNTIINDEVKWCYQCNIQ